MSTALTAAEDPKDRRVVQHPAAWAGVVILTITMILSMIDRSLPSILIEPIRATFGLKDTQLALLTGFSFALAIAIFSLPISLLVDRYDRPRLLAAGVATWCVMTMLCGFANGFWSLFLFRMGVGLGEAILLPAGYSLIADLFARTRRPRALAVFTVGTPIGVSIALAGGGALHDFYSGPGAVYAFGFAPYQAVFITVGSLGLSVAVLALFIPEPRRHHTPDAAASTQAAPLAPVIEFVRASWRFFLPLVIGVTLFTMFSNGFIAWVVPFFLREYGWTVAQTGAAMGTAMLVAGLVGAPLGAFAAARATAWRGRDAAVIVITVGAVVCLPIAVVGPLAGHPWLSFAAILCVLTSTFSAAAVAPAALMNSSPPPIRGRIAGIYVVVASLVGGGLGPVSFGLFTDYVVGDPEQIRWSLVCVSAVLLSGCIAALALASRGYDRAITEVTRLEEAAERPGQPR